MSRDNTMEVLEFLQEQNKKKLRTSDINKTESLKEHNPYDVVNFVTGNIRGYIDLEHTRSILIDRKVSLLRTKQQGYVPLEYFSDEMKIKEICSKIIELEKSAMKKLINSKLEFSSDIDRVFTPGDIIIGDSKHVSSGIYVPYVDENSVVINEEIVDSKIKKLIKDYYIDKIS